jgi:hypothetical protein
MTNIDYKAEVLKLHPSAIPMRTVDKQYYIDYFDPFVMDLISIGKGNSEQKAWKNAYENLKKE